MPVINSLHISGIPRKRRLSIRVDGGREINLRRKSFVYLLKLAVARCTTYSGLVHKQNMDAGNNQTKYFYCLRRELGDPSLVENDEMCHYALRIEPSAITFDLERLGASDDADIRREVASLAKRGVVA